MIPGTFIRKKTWKQGGLGNWEGGSPGRNISEGNLCLEQAILAPVKQGGTVETKPTQNKQHTGLFNDYKLSLC